MINIMPYAILCEETSEGEQDVGSEALTQNHIITMCCVLSATVLNPAAGKHTLVIVSAEVRLVFKGFIIKNKNSQTCWCVFVNYSAISDVI